MSIIPAGGGSLALTEGQIRQIINYINQANQAADATNAKFETMFENLNQKMITTRERSAITYQNAMAVLSRVNAILSQLGSMASNQTVSDVTRAGGLGIQGASIVKFAPTMLAMGPVGYWLLGLTVGSYLLQVVQYLTTFERRQQEELARRRKEGTEWNPPSSPEVLAKKIKTLEDKMAKMEREQAEYEQKYRGSV